MSYYGITKSLQLHVIKTSNFFFLSPFFFKHSDIKDKFLSYKLFHADIPLFGIMFLFAPPLTGLEAEQT